MTKVLLVCGADGGFVSCKASGHASFAKKGSDIVCAAVSVMLRTVMELLEQTAGVALEADTSSRGFIEFHVTSSSAQAAGRLKCAADFIRIAFSSLAREYPANVEFFEQSQM